MVQSSSRFISSGFSQEPFLIDGVSVDLALVLLYRSSKHQIIATWCLLLDGGTYWATV